ncbi:hypothetical protein MRB53_037105 [Persea americana]|nr:hypothetical protein MRB53_037105 [Persea americana]
MAWIDGSWATIAWSSGTHQGQPAEEDREKRSVTRGPYQGHCSPQTGRAFSNVLGCPLDDQESRVRTRTEIITPLPQRCARTPQGRCRLHTRISSAPSTIHNVDDKGRERSALTMMPLEDQHRPQPDRRCPHSRRTLTPCSFATFRNSSRRGLSHAMNVP